MVECNNSSQYHHGSRNYSDRAEDYVKTSYRAQEKDLYDELVCLSGPASLI